MVAHANYNCAIPDCEFQHHNLVTVRKHTAALHSICREFDCYYRGTDAMLALHEATHDWPDGPPPLPELHHIEFQLLDFLFLSRGGTFAGSAAVLNSVWPQHSLATMTAIIQKYKERWQYMSLECTGPALVEKLKGMGLLDRDA